MTKLHEILAVVDSKAKRANEALTNEYQNFERTHLFEGIERKYRQIREDVPAKPDESKRVIRTVNDAIESIVGAVSSHWNVVCTQENANQQATAAVEIDGEPITPDLPVGFLLFLEKQLQDVATFVKKMPTLDPAKEWHDDEASGLMASKSWQSQRTQKEMVRILKWEPPSPEYTQEAQVDLVPQDIVVGEWTNRDFSGAIGRKTKSELLARVVKLRDAVKQARQRANSLEIENKKVADKIFEFILEPLK